MSLSKEYMHQLLELKEWRAFVVSTRYEIQKHIQDKSEYDTSLPNSVQNWWTSTYRYANLMWDLVEFNSCFDQKVE